jgi:hypothetical protein
MNITPPTHPTSVTAADIDINDLPIPPYIPCEQNPNNNQNYPIPRQLNQEKFPPLDPLRTYLALHHLKETSTSVDCPACGGKANTKITYKISWFTHRRLSLLMPIGPTHVSF